MKFLRIPVFLIAFFIAACAHEVTTNDDRLSRELVGTWMEYSPSSNLVSFSADRQIKIYLKKGEIRDLRALVGTWAVKDGIMTATFVSNGRTISNAGKLTFENGEMLLTDTGGVVTRHRRHTGTIPSQYNW